MKFYTNVQLIGNQFLVRGVENGNRFEFRDEFFPTLYVKSKKKTKHTAATRVAIINHVHDFIKLFALLQTMKQVC